MTMLSKEEVLHIAKLARLQLTDGEVQKMQKDMSAILDYFNVLKKAPKVKVSQQLATTNQHLRADVAKPQQPGVVEKLIEAFPQKQDGYIKVKQVL